MFLLRLVQMYTCVHVHVLLSIDINDGRVTRNDKYACIYKSTQYSKEVFRKHAAHSNIKSAVQMQQNRLHKFSCWSTVLMNVEISVLLLAFPHYHKPIILPHLNITASLQITETKNKRNGFCLRTTIEAVNII